MNLISPPFINEALNLLVASLWECNLSPFSLVHDVSQELSQPPPQHNPPGKLPMVWAVFMSETIGHTAAWALTA